MFENIPLEMRTYAQWVVWRYEDREQSKPTKVPYSPNNGRLASVTDSSSWSTFEKAVHIFNSHPNWCSGIGFVLTDKDPFAFIDLDDTQGDAAALERQHAIFTEFDSYAERSPSGKGLHIIIKGEIPSGRKRSKIEIYSSLRYMTMTGDIYRDAPVKEYNELINSLYIQMGGNAQTSAALYGFAEEKETDATIIERATKASNGEKFANLYAGKWQDYYASQSEADFAIVDIIAFYTQNRAQIIRLFHASSLGKREKAQRADYVNYMLNKCFDRMLPAIDVEGLSNQLRAAMESTQRAATVPTVSAATPAPVLDPYSVPPGLVGDIARFIYAQAPRPVPEIALAGAIGLVAGIVGRAYNISSTGLNQYVLLLAPTGTGKEAIASGIDKLLAMVIKTVPAAVDFMGPGEIASPQALIKYMSKTANSFVSLVGEFGIYLQEMASPNAPPHLKGLKRMMLDLYNKSGEGKVLRPSIYSNTEKNTLSVLSPSFTLLGESTPEKFYEGLHEGMISEGLLPRFTIIEYKGQRPELNEAHASVKPSFELVDKLSALAAYAAMLNNQHKVTNVIIDVDSKKLFDDFNAHCDMNINASDREIRKHLWNRAHIKALKLAALVSVGINSLEPNITSDVATWSIAIIVRDVRNMLDKFESGEIGIDNDETKQLSQVASAIKSYVVSPWSEVSKYAGEDFEKLHGERIINYSFV